MRGDLALGPARRVDGGKRFQPTLRALEHPVAELRHAVRAGGVLCRILLFQAFKFGAPTFGAARHFAGNLHCVRHRVVNGVRDDGRHHLDAGL